LLFLKKPVKAGMILLWPQGFYGGLPRAIQAYLKKAISGPPAQRVVCSPPIRGGCWLVPEGTLKSLPTASYSQATP